MATDTLTVVRDPANSERDLVSYSAEIQIQASRIKSLARAIDDALDHSTHDDVLRSAMERALDFTHMVEEAAEKAREAGERVEVAAMRLTANVR